MNNCKVCNGPLAEGFMVREMMLGKRDEFEYAQCTNCGTIQILEIPKNIEDYYPEYYYSFKEDIPLIKRLSGSKRLFNKYRIKRKYREQNIPIFRYLKPLKTTPSSRILDIGCGRGKLICEMFNLGFENVQGVDKFVTAEYDYDYGVKVLKKDLSELENKRYNLLMMHHVFEHMDEPLEELKKCFELLKSKGYLIIRIPVVGRAWDIYGKDWIQLDAPRHFFIHTEKSMTLLAERAGFEIANIIYDSAGFQFWGSELYKRDIALVENTTKNYRIDTDFFSDEELRIYDQQAKDLNDARKGDQAIFYLRKL